MDENNVDRESAPIPVPADLQKRVGHVRPVGQPEFVHQLTKILFAPYHVENGTVSLEGCFLEEVPFLLVEGADGQPRRFFDQEGQPLAEAFVQSLGLDELTPMTGPPPSLRPSAVASWIERTWAKLPEATRNELASVPHSIAWCHWAHGKLSFTIGERSHQLPFQGWAVQFAKGQVRPPKFSCPRSGRHSYQIVATDDGRLTVPEAIEVCQVSGRRCLDADLETCPASGTRALPEYFVECEASEDRVVASARVPCPQCGQAVARHRLQGEKCVQCRGFQPLKLSDSPWQTLVEELPEARGFHRWNIAEGPRKILLRGSSWRGQLILVIDPQAANIKEVRRKPVFASRWRSATPPEVSQRP